MRLKVEGRERAISRELTNSSFLRLAKKIEEVCTRSTGIAYINWHSGINIMYVSRLVNNLFIRYEVTCINDFVRSAIANSFVPVRSLEEVTELAAPRARFSASIIAPSLNCHFVTRSSANRLKSGRLNIYHAVISSVKRCVTIVSAPFYVFSTNRRSHVITVPFLSFIANIFSYA